MYTRLAGWWARTKKRGEGTWWLLILLIVLFIAEHRIAGKVNSLIDEKSGKFLILTKDVLSWTMQDTLGIAGMIFLGFLMFLVTIAFIETSPTVQRWAKTKHLVLTDDKEKPGKGGASLLEVEFDRTCFEEVVHSKLTELDISLGVI